MFTVARATRLLFIFGRLEDGDAASFVCCPLGLVSLPSKTHKLYAPLLKCLQERGVFFSCLLAQLLEHGTLNLWRSSPPHDEWLLCVRKSNVVAVPLAVNHNIQWKQYVHPNGPTLIVVYPLLSDSWLCGKPKNELRDAYLRRLGDAVYAFNRVRVWSACRRPCDALAFFLRLATPRCCAETLSTTRPLTAVVSGCAQAALIYFVC
jgi:hypothetical protein